MNGLMRGVVVKVDDPDQRGRVQCAIPDLFLDGDTDTVLDSQWCEPKGGGLFGAGSFDVPKVGTQVWVQAVYSAADDKFDLVYERGTVGKSKSGSFAPAVGRGQDDESVQLKVSPTFSVPSPNTSLERKGPNAGAPARPAQSSGVDIPGIPSSANAGAYPHNKVLKTEGGFVLELDDTPGQERLQLHHPSGASVEVYGDGVWTQRSAKKWEEVLEHSTSHVWGDVRTRVDGNVCVGVGGNQVEETTGRRVITAGELDLKSRFDLLMEVGGMLSQRVSGPAVQRFLSDWKVISGGGINVSSAASLKLTSALGSMAFTAPFGSVSVTALTGLDVQGIVPTGLVNYPVVIMTPALLAYLATLGAHTHPVEGVLAGPSVELKTATLAIGAGALVASPMLRAQGVLS